MPQQVVRDEPRRTDRLRPSVPRPSGHAEPARRPPGSPSAATRFPGTPFPAGTHAGAPEVRPTRPGRTTVTRTGCAPPAPAAALFALLTPGSRTSEEPITDDVSQLSVSAQGPGCLAGPIPLAAP